MYKLAINRPITTLMYVITLVIFGYMSFKSMPSALFPNIDFPIVTIKTVYPGAESSTIESQLTDKIEEAITRLSRVGFDNTIGYLKGGVEAWQKAGKQIDTIRSISAEDFAKEVQENGQAIFDVRKDGEYLSEHIENAQHTSLEFINEHLSAFPKDDHFYVHCAGGYRSVIAASILKSRGYHNLTDVAGGYDAIKNTDIKKTDYVCPTTL